MRPAAFALNLFVLATALSACSLSEEKWQDKQPEALCDYYQSCDPPFYADRGGCLEDVLGEQPALGSCDYDPDAAAECLDALAGRTCEGSASNLPSSCSTVYTCEGGE